MTTLHVIVNLEASYNWFSGLRMVVCYVLSVSISFLERKYNIQCPISTASDDATAARELSILEKAVWERHNVLSLKAFYK